ncbi:RNA polymerase sigma factor [Dinghuibacter silviterrae]|uniref:RNA polymerase sigma-70 factor (ECF subfamily) n=1 Tax=Dinghuibacter silviterrae TaxID=1539049 RepID=A0A4R8DGA6_9BACT|nr:sigma-70 family RNA polymerase sigma factor [Dinghuibacter silviterrae]TDW96487.1 RNA polymerase sigma-70 factor (ECF subfamily) [Dinghuibacter silviterrae]
MPPSDDDIRILIKGCLDNDRKAQEQVYSMFYEAMMLLCLRYTKNEADAVEVLNNGFLKVFKKIGQYDPSKAALSTWIRSVIVHAAIDFIRVRKPPLVSMSPSYEEASPIENVAIQKIAAGELLALVQQLPGTTRLVFNLYVMEGFNHREIASLLDMNEGTSRWHLSEARKLLKQTIQLQQVKT